MSKLDLAKNIKEKLEDVLDSNGYPQEKFWRQLFEKCLKPPFDVEVIATIHDTVTIFVDYTKRNPEQRILLFKNTPALLKLMLDKSLDILKKKEIIQTINRMVSISISKELRKRLAKEQSEILSRLVIFKNFF